MFAAVKYENVNGCPEAHKTPLQHWKILINYWTLKSVQPAAPPNDEIAFGLGQLVHYSLVEGKYRLISFVFVLSLISLLIYNLFRSSTYDWGLESVLSPNITVVNPFINRNRP